MQNISLKMCKVMKSWAFTSMVLCSKNWDMNEVVLKTMNYKKIIFDKLPGYLTSEEQWKQKEGVQMEMVE